MTDQTAVPCNAAQLHRFGDLATTHGPHEWIVQPGMDPVRCPGAGEQSAAPAGQAPATDQTAVRPHTFVSIACHLDARAVAIMRPDSQTYAEWQIVAAWLRRMADETQPAEAHPAAAVLSDAERTMLTYALDQAQERIWSEDGFTDEDQAAVDSLRRLTAAARQDGAQPTEDARPTPAYSDGKGRTYCLGCRTAVGADVPLTATDVGPWELCAACGRHVVDVATAAWQDEPVVTVHAAPDLSPEATEALGALVDVAKQQIQCDFPHPHPEHPCGRRTTADARQDGEQR